MTTKSDVGTEATLAPTSGTDATLAPTSGTEATIASSGSGRAAGPAAPSELPEIPRSAYLIKGELARGGMGKILVAEDTRLGRDVALKELLVSSGALAERFAREVRTTARLQHPGIVAVYEAGRWPDGEPFYAMRLVKGKPLEVVVEQRPKLEDRLGLVANLVHLSEAMAYAHDRGVIHRDLKPANVLVGDYGETVVIDWGLAKDLAAAEVVEDLDPQATMPSGDALTVVGSVVGTPAYMPPEQARGEQVDKRADVYSLGALMWHVLAGRAPFTGKSVDEVLGNVQKRALPSLAKVAPEAPAELVTIVERAMAADPDQRYPSARELAEELAGFAAGKLIASHRYTTRELALRWLRKHKTLVAVGAALVIAAIVVTVITMRQVVRERDRAREQNLATLEDRGRAELLADRPRRAAVFLGEAYAGGRASEALRIMLADAMLAVDANVATLATTAEVTHVAWVRGGTHVAAITGAAVVVHDVTAGTSMAIARTSRGRPRSIAVSEDGTTLVVADQRSVAIFDVVAGRQLHGHDLRSTELAVSRDGKTVAISDGSYLHLSVGGALRELPVGPSEIAAIGFSREGLIVVRRGGIDVQDPTSGLPLLAIAAGPGMALGGAVVCDGVVYANQFADEDTLGATYGASDPDEPQEIVVRRAGSTDLLDIGDGTLGDIACGKQPIGTLLDDRLGVEGEPELVTLADDMPLRLVRPTTIAGERTTFAVDPDGRLAAIGLSTGELQLFELASSVPLAVIDAHDKAITALAFDSRGRVVSASDDGALRIWDTASWKATVVPYEVSAHLMAFEPEQRSADGRVTVRTVMADLVVEPGGKRLVGLEDQIDWFAVSHDGRHVAAHSGDDRLILWDATTGEAKGSWTLAFEPVRTRLLDDGRILAGGSDGTTRMYHAHVATPTLLGGHAGEVFTIEVAPDHRILTADSLTARHWTSAGELAGAIGDGALMIQAWWLDGGAFVATDTLAAYTMWEVASGRAVFQRRHGGVEDAQRRLHAMPEPSAPRGVRLIASGSVLVVPGRETRTPAAITALLARVPWRLADGELALRTPLPTIAPAPERDLTGDKSYDFSEELVVRGPPAPRLAIASDEDAYARAWALQRSGDAAAALALLRPRLAEPAVLDDALRFAAWGQLDVAPVLAVIGDTPEMRLALAEHDAVVGAYELAERALDFTGGGEVGMRREYALAELARTRGEPVLEAKRYLAALALAGTLPAPASPPPLVCGQAGSGRPSDPAPLERALDAALLVERARRALERDTMTFLKTRDFRYGVAAERLFEGLAAVLVASEVTACRQVLEDRARSFGVKGDLDKALVRLAFRTAIPAVGACYEAALARDATLAGTILLEFVAEVDHIVMQRTKQPPALEAVAACIAKAVSRVRVPKAAGGARVHITWPVVLQLPPSAPPGP